MDLPPTISLEIEAGVGLVTLDRPAKLNAINGPMWTALHDVADFAAAAPPEELRVLVFAGAGKGVLRWRRLRGVHCPRER